MVRLKYEMGLVVWLNRMVTKMRGSKIVSFME
jgi:hypothetical protein